MTKTNWKNLPNTTTPINATNLNAIEDRLVNISNEVDEDYRVNLLKSKNLFNGLLELGTYSNDGVKSDSTANYRNVNTIKVKPNTTYTTSINGNAQQYVMYFYNKNKIFLEATDNRTGTFTTPSNCYYVNFRCYGADYTSDFASLKIQLEEGNEATTYKEFIQNQIIVDDIKYTDTLNVGSVVDNRSRVNVLKSHNIFNKSTLVNRDMTNAVADNKRITSRQLLYLKAGTYTFKTNLNTSTYSYGLSTNSSNPMPSNDYTNIYTSGYTTNLTTTFTITSQQEGYFMLTIRKIDNSALALSDVSGFKYSLARGDTATDNDYFEPSIVVDNEEIYSKDNLEQYSTNEIRIGTWIDGKPLYRKVFYITSNLSSALDIAHGISNIKYIKVEGYLTTSLTNTPPFYNNSTDFFRVFRNGAYLSTRYGSGISATSITFIVEYTKTTD